MRIVKLLAATAAATLLVTPAAQAAQTGYPEKPVRLIIGSAAGSGPDIIARLVSDRLYESWNQRIVVDARPGAAGAVSGAGMDSATGSDGIV